MEADKENQNAQNLGDGIKPEDVVYSSQDILSSSVAGENTDYFNRVKKDIPLKERLATRINKHQATSKRSRFNNLIQNKKFWLVIIICLVGIVLGIGIFFLITKTSDQAQQNQDQSQEEMNAIASDIADENEESDSNLATVSPTDIEAENLFAAGTDEAFREGRDIYEEELSGLEENTAQYLDVIMRYGRALYNAERYSEAIAVLVGRMDIDNYTKTEDQDEYEYTIQLLNYYGLLRSAYELMSNSEQAAIYNQKIIELSNRETELAGEAKL